MDTTEAVSQEGSRRRGRKGLPITSRSRSATSVARPRRRSSEATNSAAVKAPLAGRQHRRYDGAGRGLPAELPMTHDEALWQAIIDAPEEDAPRLVYADWLEEHGQPERAEFIRVQCELAKLPECDA